MNAPDHRAQPMTPWQAYRSWGPKSRTANARVCCRCGAATHWPAREGWRWRVVKSTTGKQGQATEAVCHACLRANDFDIPGVGVRQVKG